ncbi:MAG: ABC transporter permease DevC [Scytonematopsis contorta HA4267-MV1]|jgi:putative ABC transport system permease protein|nr:ABC transporter permease DevC [Scytonematopsis contorta HA4267-MV1]
MKLITKNPTFKSLKEKLQLDIPLAWSQLSHQKMRLLVAMGGIAFANVLIFMQLGFKELFTGGATAFPTSLNGDLFLLHKDARFLGSIGFERLRIYQAAGIKGVKDTIPLYIDTNIPWSYTTEHKSYEARVIAFNPQKKVFNIPEINQQTNKLSLPNSFLYDRLSRQELGPLVPEFEKTGKVTALINRRKIDINGLFNLGNSFFLSAGTLVTSEANYIEIFGSNALNRVSVGIVILEPGANLQAVKAGIEKNIPGIVAYTHQELIAKELKFNQDNPAGTIFSFGAIMGFIVGVVIVYQVLYADVSDHLAEYATLKAMGYSDIGLLLVIFQEATILAVLGFIPGFFASVGMYNFLAGLTRLELVMTPDIAITVFILTLVMCLISALVASSKLRSADPADVF